MGRTQLVACLLTSLLGASCAEAHSRSLSLVLADLHIEPRDEAGRAAGVDLDGLDTTAEGRTCTHSSLDHVSLYDDSERGVDNLMAALPPSGVTRTVASSPRPSVQDGSYLLAIRVDGIDSFADDEAVTVTVRRVELAGCRSGGPCRPILEGDRLAADQRFVAAGPELAGVGSIADGRLRAELPELAVPAVAWFPASEHPGFEHRLRGVRLEADIDATGLQRGTLGGSLPVEDVLRLLSLARPDIPIEEVEPILVNMADLEPQAGGECASMSVGLSLSAVRATLE